MHISPRYAMNVRDASDDGNSLLLDLPFAENLHGLCSWQFERLLEKGNREMNLTKEQQWWFD